MSATLFVSIAKDSGGKVAAAAIGNPLLDGAFRCHTDLSDLFRIVTSYWVEVDDNDAEDYDEVTGRIDDAFTAGGADQLPTWIVGERGGRLATESVNPNALH